MKNTNTIILAMAGALSSVMAETTNDSNNDPLNNGYKAKLSLDQYTVTLMCLFILQIVFCFGICHYTSSRVKAAELRNEKQKAEFYSFIYQFHK